VPDASLLAAIKGHRPEAAMLMELALGRRRSKILAVEWDVMMGICRSVRHGYTLATVG